MKAKKNKKEPLPLTRPILTLWEVEHSHPPSAPPPPPKRPSPLHAQHSLHLSRLPSAALYERSYMHREQLTHLLLTPLTSFLLTASRDGCLKWWKKVKASITFVRQYRAHEGALVSLTCDASGTNAASIGFDRWVKWFDVLNFDLVHMLQLGYDAAAAVWVHEKEGKATLCVSSRTTPELFLYHNDSMQPVQVVDSGGKGPGLQLSAFTAHTRPVCLLAFHPVHAVAVSVDLSGVIDYWSTVTFTSPTSPVVSFTSRLDTDLYAFARLSLVPTSLTFSHSGHLFVTTSADRILRVFRFSSGRLVKQFDDSLPLIHAQQTSGNPVYHLDAIDFGRRMQVERDMEKTARTHTITGPTSAQQLATTGLLPVSNAVFDDSDTFLIFASMIGVKVVNVHTNMLVRLLGKGESSERFTALALFQGLPVDAESAAARQGVSVLVGGGSAVGEVAEDPCLFALAYRRDRFYWFSQREPDEEVGESEGEGKDGGGGQGGKQLQHKASSRDVLNERPQATSTSSSLTRTAASTTTSTLPSHATLHTTMGDIVIQLYPTLTPRTYDNFTTHSRRGYYNGCLFHRVIRDFMVQTGDPQGDGTGGESVWGGQFEDEVRGELKHDREGVVSMANAGKNTNGSQFFITTVECAWLDGKHTVFGRVEKGMEVVKAIERVKVEDSRPITPIRIISIDITP